MPPPDAASPPVHLVREVGSGATSIVYEVELERPVGDLPAGARAALKRLRPETRERAAARRAFETERRAAREVRSAHLPRHLADGEDAEGPWLLTELVRGPSLRQRLEREERLPEPEVRTLLAEVATALADLAAAGCVHGAVQPANVLFTEAGAVLLDLGFARPLGSDAPARERRGTPLYLAPELLRGAPATPASDVYALGLVAFEAVTGVHPRLRSRGERPDEWLSSLVAARPDLASSRWPEASPFLDEWIDALLDPDPARRPSAEEARRSLTEGEAGPWWRALARRPPQPPIDPRQELPLVGREEELARLGAVWREVWDLEQPGHAWLRAEEGLGKSRLATELARRLRRGTRPPIVLSARCPSELDARPMLPLLQVLARSLGRSIREAPGPRERERLGTLVPPATAEVLLDALEPEGRRAPAASVPEALAEWLAAYTAQHPLLLFLDDVQHADAETLEALGRTVERCERGRLLLLLGRRARGAARRPEELRRLTGRLLRRGPRISLELAPLGRSAIEALVRRIFSRTAPRLRLVEVLLAESRGVPGLLAEILRDAAVRRRIRPPSAGEDGWILVGRPEELRAPRSLREAIRSSFERLGDEERRWLVRIAAVGDRVERETLRRAWGGADPERTARVLARLIQEGWLELERGRLRFRAPAQREAVLGAVPPAELRRLHAEIAEALRPRGRERPDLSRAFQRLYHLRLAGEDEALERELWPLLDMVAERGQTRRVHTLCAWGLEVLERRPQDERNRRRMLDLLERAADAADLLGLREDQRRALDRLADFDFARDPAAAGRVYLLHARYAISVGQYGLARAMLKNAVELLERSGDRAHLSDALRRFGAVASHVGDLETARRHLRRARNLAPTPLLRSLCEVRLGVLDLLEDRIEQALKRSDRAAILLRRAETRAVRGARASLLVLRARAYRCAGRPRRALGSAQRALKNARAAGDRRLEVEARARLGGHELDLDRVEEAEADLREALRAALEIEDRRGEALAALFLGILLAEGERPGARRELDRAIRRAAELELGRLEAVALAIRARLTRLEGRLEEAYADALRADALLERFGAEWMDRVVIAGTRALLENDLGHAEAARERMRKLERRLRRLSTSFSSPLLERRHRLAAARLLRAVRSPEGPVFPRVRIPI